MSNQVDLPKHTIISYRSSPDKAARFLNVDKLEKSKNFEKINKIYKNISQSITSYDPQHVQGLINVENRLHERMLDLKNEDKSTIDSYTTGFKGLIVTIATFGLNHLVGHYKKKQIEKEIEEINTNREHFQRALGQMESRAAEKTIYPKPQIIQNLESKRLADPTDELARLEESPRIKKSFTDTARRKHLNDNQKIAFGHSLELQEQIQDTHYVFNHGQNLELMVVNMITKMLEQEFEGKRYDSVEPLRHHDTALQHIQEDTHTINWFKEKIGTEDAPQEDNDTDFRKELICGDCILESTRNLESALSFYLENKNILVDE